MEQIEEGLILAAAVFFFCLAVSCLFAEQRILLALGNSTYQNYHQESLIEEIEYE